MALKIGIIVNYNPSNVTTYINNSEGLREISRQYGGPFTYNDAKRIGDSEAQTHAMKLVHCYQVR